jgi:hypothetical protein
MKSVAMLFTQIGKNRMPIGYQFYTEYAGKVYNMQMVST